MELYNNLVWNKQDYNLSQAQEYLELTLYSMLCFLVPFLVGHPQTFVGVLVNVCLVLTALNLKSKMVAPAILLPSLGVLTRGLIFGPFTIFLVYMVPFIWAGNFLLVYVFKRMVLSGNSGKLLTVFTASFVKSAFLFSAAFVLVNVNLIPAVFLTAMGVLQFATAFVGALIALGIHESKKKLTYRL